MTRKDQLFNNFKMLGAKLTIDMYEKDYSLTELYNRTAEQTINEPSTKYMPNVMPSKNRTDRMTTKIIEIADAKLLCKLSKYFITRDIYIPPTDKNP